MLVKGLGGRAGLGHRWSIRFAGVWLAAAFGAASACAQDTTGATTQLGGPSSQQQAYCRQLERDLAPDWQQSASAADLVPRLEAQMARADQQLQRSQALAEHSDCFDYFLFSKTWRDSGQCRQLHQQVQDAQRSLADLDRQRKGAFAAQDRASRQDALVSELARNQCGPQYTAALQGRTGAGGAGFWSDSEGGGPGNVAPGFQNVAPGSTFRTICVRMCDGYYFPISFAATQDRLQHDAQACQSQCSGPAKLYYYPNPGGEVQQAVGIDGTPYTSLPNAFRYRKELVSSCSCKGQLTAPETVSDTQPILPARSAASGTPLKAGGNSAPAGTDADQAPSLPAAEFGTMSIETVQPDGSETKSTD